jgi:glycosyltransferase involved in cell wall biosynthesis
MQEKPIVSVICLCYNHSEFVIECLNSILNQTYKNIEIIIVDDCSTDKSVAVINDFLYTNSNIQFIANSINLGSTKSFNQALKIAKGEYIIDLATDDVLLLNCVELQLAKFKNSTLNNLGIVYGNAENILENGIHDSYYYDVNTIKKVINSRQKGDIYTQVLAGGDSYCSASAMIKKSVYDDLNGYDETLVYEDLDFWIRASRKYNIDFIDEILMQKRIVKNSLGSQFFNKNHKINYSTYLILKKAIGLNRNKAEDLALLKRVHYEIFYCFKNRIFHLLLRNIVLKGWLFFRINFGYL